MNQKEIKELIEFLVEKDIAEFELERGDMKLHIKRGAALQPAPVVHVAPAIAAAPAIPVPAAPVAIPSHAEAPAGGDGAATSAAAQPSAAPDAEAAEAGLFIVKSPIVGTFYEAPSPGAPPFVRIGDLIQEGQALCIIEAMKLMNEIEAEVSGVLAKAFVANGTPVEYGMPLFGIRKQ
jgi:acetyl-CoA carboxylase biotin carboxyl carrier protein